ncbi:MAG: NADH dehydrogenase [Acidithiobacillales bacterium SM23_46]|jgi:NADH-quinone oxidoreductase subunit C|nr:MAG: NADH dehydrogenase [Thiotrichales bacterium SG8_50]KPK70157.1 MAG: NADH dehydrogenase [Acidithiobacillales bacterium SM23_46]KPL27046.1 MAG: NADH dehydrogenase [Acidithiobacillales bacterium SM1_46]
MASTEAFQALAARAAEKFGDAIVETTERLGELTLVLHREQLLRACRILRDDKDFGFEQLIDVCGVDYSAFGEESAQGPKPGPRYAAVYHLLSLRHNRRLRLKVFLDDEMPMVESVVGIWNSANWFEREAFDLFGIVFEGHPDLRRILTDYGFIGHPFRKDFPVSGHVEMRYDPEKQRVVYQPVSIEPRVLVPRVIRDKGFARG